MKRKMVLTAVVLLGLLCAAVAQAAGFDVTTAFGSGADGYIQNDSSKGPTVTTGMTYNRGMEMRNYLSGTTDRLKMLYLRFDISSVPSDKLAGAILKLNVNNMNSCSIFAETWDVYGLIDETGDNWTESTTSYSTAPGLVSAPLGSYAFDPARMTKLGIMSVNALKSTAALPTQGLKVSNTTDLNLDSFIAADTNKLLTFAIINTNTCSANGDVWFTSKDSTAQYLIGPLPTLTFVPEPATMLILGLGSLMVVRRKRS
jgi:hypothetical protein